MSAKLQVDQENLEVLECLLERASALTELLHDQTRETLKQHALEYELYRKFAALLFTVQDCVELAQELVADTLNPPERPPKQPRKPTTSGKVVFLQGKPKGRQAKSKGKGYAD
jgi:hypothetical protein